MFTVRTLGLRQLYGFVALGHGRHGILRTDEADRPTAQWLALDKDAPLERAIEDRGRLVSRPILGGLHRRYARKLSE
ncbi:MAG: hypothetical protein AB7O49_06330 [Sphingomonadales bacterium]